MPASASFADPCSLCPWSRGGRGARAWGSLSRPLRERKFLGRVWLQFEVEESGRRTVIRQTTVFDPAGYVGLVYWYLLYPVHHMIFGAMLRGLREVLDPDQRLL